MYNILAKGVSFSRDGFRKTPLSPIHQTYARKDIKEVKLQPGCLTPATHTNTTYTYINPHTARCESALTLKKS